MGGGKESVKILSSAKLLFHIPSMNRGGESVDQERRHVSTLYVFFGPVRCFLSCAGIALVS